MNYSDDYINKILDDEVVFSNEVALKYHYPDNITHLLYIIVPAFILKYGLNYRSLIHECFSSVPIKIYDRQDKIYQAYYYSRPIKSDDKIVTQKGIVLNNYKDIELMQLIDNLVHEFNHAINSMQNEIMITSDIKIRTGIVYNYFDINSLRFIKQDPEIIIEEVINTRQTEMVIDIIHSFSNYQINNSTIASTLYSINYSIGTNYESNSYLLESYVCKQLLKNKTFISTLENLRFIGQVDDIKTFFDSVTGFDNSFIELAMCLNKSIKLQNELVNRKWFRKSKIRQIQEINKRAMDIVNLFNNNTIYK